MKERAKMTTNLKIGDLYRNTTNQPWAHVCKITGENETHVWGHWGVGAMYCAPMMKSREEAEALIETGGWVKEDE
jgi:hypothetical protein